MGLGRGIWRATRLAAAGALCLAALWLVLGGSGAGASAKSTPLGATSTARKAEAALAGTGYKILYRKVPRVKGYEMLSGEAIQGRHGIQFVIVIAVGPNATLSSEGGSAQSPVLRYQGESTGEIAGNVYLQTVENSPMKPSNLRPGKDLELDLNEPEVKMEIKVDIAIEGLVAPRYRPGI
jgi:hypothetical protein